MKKRRPRGSGGLYLRGRIWWISYHVSGKPTQESSRSTSREDAKRLLRDRLASVDQGKIAAGKPITLTQLESLIATDIETSQRSSNRFRYAFRHLRRVLGDSTRVRDLTHADIEAYKKTRLSEQAARATVNVELAMLKKGLSLARRHGRLPVPPEVTGLPGARIRQGFLDDDAFREVHAKLPPDVQDPVLFLFLTGWRVGEALNLEWRQVDLKAKVIRIEKTKNRVPRTIPYGALPELARLIEARWRERERRGIDPRVFGRIAGVTLWRAFKEACEKSGYPGRTTHDLRRSAARRMLRAGVPQPVIMQICGWKTDSVFRRYAIVDEVLIADGLSKLGKG